MSIRFALDDLPWSGEMPDQATLMDGLKSLARMLAEAAERREPVFTSDELYEVARVGSLSLYELLFDNDMHLPQSLRVELQRRLDKIRTLQADDIVEIDVTVNETKHTAATVAYAAVQSRDDNAVAVLTPNFSDRRGPIAISCGDSWVLMHFVSDEESRLVFAREVISGLIDESEFAKTAPSAFPRLFFVEDVFDGLRRLSKPLVDIAQDLVEHLSVLSDYGREIFDGKTHHKIEVDFRGYGIDISPENRATLDDAECRRARSRTVEGETLVFDWHTKIQPHQDRIYVHPGSTATRGCVAVGVIHKHLPLPGD